MDSNFDSSLEPDNIFGLSRRDKEYKLKKRNDRQKTRERQTALASGLIPLDPVTGKPEYVSANPQPAPQQQDGGNIQSSVGGNTGGGIQSITPSTSMAMQAGGGNDYVPQGNPDDEPNYNAPNTNIPVKVQAQAAPKSNNTKMLMIAGAVVAAIILFVVLRKK
jgi:hypothetical protein